MRLHLLLVLLLTALWLMGCRTAPKLPDTHNITGPDPKGETHQLARKVSLPLPNGTVQELTVNLVRPPPNTNWTNPVPKIGTAIQFWPLTNSAYIRYIGQWSTNLVDWQTFTNCILEGAPAKPFNFLLADGTEQKRFLRVVWVPR